MKPAVFLSYAEENALDARHIHEVLRETNAVDVWGYREDGQIGVDFHEEFRDRIRQSKYFCLIDSPYARRSAWIRQECNLARTSGSITAICRIGADGPWQEEELFPNQNLIRAIDLTDFDRGIRRLCDYLQVRYTHGLTLPRDRDFEREIFAPGLDPDRASEIYGLYREFRERGDDPAFGEAQLRVIIRKCCYYRALHVVSPSLALAIFEGIAGRHSEAVATFREIVSNHPRDPRGWAGLGGALYYLGSYRESLDALERAIHAAQTWYPADSADRIPELLHNIASVQFALGELDKSEATLAHLTPGDRSQPQILALRGRILLRRRDFDSALLYLSQAHQGGPDLSPTLVTDLADCYLAIYRRSDELQVLRSGLKAFPDVPDLWSRAADAYLRSNNTPEAVAAMRRAAELTPTSPRFRSQLAALLCRIRKIEEGEAEAIACTGLAAPTPFDRYHRGLAWWVLGETEAADAELAYCRSNAIVAHWPPYSRICRCGRKARRAGSAS